MREIAIASDGASLRASVWTPDDATSTRGVVLVGGSGPTDRSNGGYFDPLRERLVDAGIAVLAWDKRGVGASTGSWASADVETLAGDLRAAVEALRSWPTVDAARVGTFGHSEGGWVALRACDDGVGVRSLVLNSCPAVSFIESEVFALGVAGVPEAASRELFGRLRAAARQGSDAAAARKVVVDVSHPALGAALRQSGFQLTDQSWDQLIAWIDYAPLNDLKRLNVPALAIYGSEDPLAPVDVSRRQLAEVAPALQCRIFDGADHRVCIDGALAGGYLETVTDWHLAHL